MALPGAPFINMAGASRRLDSAENQRTVGTTEAKVVVNRNINLHVSGGVRAKIQRAFRILLKDVDSRWSNLMVYCQCAEQRLYTAGATQQVTRHGLGRTDDQLVGMVAKRQPDCFSFVFVTERCRGAMSIDV